MKNFNFNRAWESYVSSEILPIQKYVFNIYIYIKFIQIANIWNYKFKLQITNLQSFWKEEKYL